MNQPLLVNAYHQTGFMDIRTEQLRIFYSAVPSSLAIILINSVILATVQWNQIDHSVIIGWVIAVNALSLARLFLNRQFRNLDQRNLPITKSWHQLAIASCTLSGITWGSAGVLLFPEQAYHHQIFLAFVLGGMSAGSITALSVIPAAAISFLTLTLSPLVFQFFFCQTPLSYPMAIMLLLFLVMLIASVKRSYATTLDSLNAKNQHNLAEQTLKHQELYDELTRLPNKTLFLILLNQEATRAIRLSRWGAVFNISVDHLQSINDRFGSDIGDRLLGEVSARITANLRTLEDIAARISGNEFAVMLPETGTSREIASQTANLIAEKIRRACEDIFDLDGHEISASVSIGMSLFPHKNNHAPELMQLANIARYQARNEGGNRIEIFT